MVVDCLVVVSFVVRGASSSVTLGLTTVIPDCRKNLCYPKRDSVVVSYWAKLQILITLNSGPRVETLSLQPFAPLAEYSAFRQGGRVGIWKSIQLKTLSVGSVSSNLWL